MQMADGDGKSVSGVKRLRGSTQAQQARDHLLDLVLLSPAVADYGALDAKRRIFGNRATVNGSRQHSDAANLAQLQSRLGIHRVKHLFNRHRVRPGRRENA